MKQNNDKQHLLFRFVTTSQAHQAVAMNYLIYALAVLRPHEFDPSGSPIFFDPRQNLQSASQEPLDTSIIVETGNIDFKVSLDLESLFSSLRGLTLSLQKVSQR